MEKKENILSEIRAVAPALADVGNNMPFEVPEAYFELFPLQMLAKVAAPFQQPSVPAGYFEAMPAIMLAKVKVLENADELADVAPALIGVSRKMPYNVPAGYFENLQADHRQTVIAISSDELSDVAPALIGISRKMPYSIPAGYFENLEATHEEATPIIPIRSKFNISKWAVAASVVVLAGFFAWQFLGNTPAEKSNQVAVNAATIDSISSAELATALASLENASLDTELDDAGMPKDTRSALYYLDTENFETALHDFSDEEIKTQLADQVTIKNKT
ncbi:hypothetical protein BH10BAC3_BH10BAC3_31250 [soil metagenome]